MLALKLKTQIFIEVLMTMFIIMFTVFTKLKS